MPYDPCIASSPLSPSELLAGIETIVVLCMENRSFDHYLGSLQLEGKVVSGLAGTESNFDADGQEHVVYRLLDYTNVDLPHDWDPVHAQWADGAMSGFMSEAGPDKPHTMGYFTREELPLLYALADQGVVCDQWFCSVLGPTWPNRYHIHCATSNGRTNNVPASPVPTSIWDRLSAAGVSAKNYFHDLPWKAAGLFEFDSTAVENFFTAAAAGTLPAFCLIDPAFLVGANDDHPAHDVRLGQALIGSVVAALAQSPQWDRCLFVLTYDEHGGFYDHVTPPRTEDSRAEFRQLGMRVPSIVIGPHVRRGCVSSNVFEHATVMRTVEQRFGLPPLNERCAATNDLSLVIDARRIADPLPPPVLPEVQVSLGAVKRMRPDPTRHREIGDAIDAMGSAVPKSQDRRAQGLEVAEWVLREGVRLGAVKLVP